MRVKKILNGIIFLIVPLLSSQLNAQLDEIKVHTGISWGSAPLQGIQFSIKPKDPYKQFLVWLELNNEEGYLDVLEINLGNKLITFDNQVLKNYLYPNLRETSISYHQRLGEHIFHIYFKYGNGVKPLNTDCYDEYKDFTYLYQIVRFEIILNSLEDSVYDKFDACLNIVKTESLFGYLSHRPMN